MIPARSVVEKDELSFYLAVLIFLLSIGNLVVLMNNIHEWGLF